MVELNKENFDAEVKESELPVQSPAAASAAGKR